MDSEEIQKQEIMFIRMAIDRMLEHLSRLEQKQEMDKANNYHKNSPPCSPVSDDNILLDAISRVLGVLKSAHYDKTDTGIKIEIILELPAPKGGII